MHDLAPNSVGIELNTFDHDIDTYVTRAIGKGVQSFSDLIEVLPSIWPPGVLTSLHRLEARGTIKLSALQRLQQEARAQPHSCYSDVERVPLPRSTSALPIAHPLDYEWRFDQRAHQYLFNKISQIASTKDKVALLGTPSLIPLVLSRETMGQSLATQWILLDANRAIVERLAEMTNKETATVSVSVCDIARDPLPPIAASVVVADPPWYPEYFRAFLWAACAVSRPGAELLLSFPSVGTRPDIECERQALIETAENMGAICKGVEFGVLPYRMPLFEYNALRAAGALGVPLDWRRGDLIILSCTSPLTVPRPLLSAQKQWTEIGIEGTRWRVKTGADLRSSDPSLVSIVPGDVLPSVSRRDVLHHEADIWTSGNRIYKCSNCQTLSVILQAIADDSPIVEAVSRCWSRLLSKEEKATILKTSMKIMDIVQTEQIERSLFEGTVS